MKVLMIGQLPKEVGGNYTTGAAKVLYELTKQHCDSVILYTYATNLKNKKAQKICHYKNEYIGYRYLLFDILIDFLLHPINTVKEWMHYKNVDHDNPLRYALYKANIKRAINIIHPDIIHVHSIGNVSPVRYALNKERIPILLTCHGIFYRGEAEGRLRDIHLGNIHLADYYSGLTEESRLEYESLLGIEKKNVCVIPNGVDCKKFYYDSKKRGEIRGRMHLSDDTKVFITVASIQERKGQLEFVKLLSKIDFNYQYWLVGRGPDEHIIKEFITENGLQDRVILLGYKDSDELFGYYSASDVYAHVSTMEGQALCEIEARATGLRVIVNKSIVGTLPEISNESHYIIDMKNPNISEMTKWVMNNNVPRVSNSSLDWSVISNKYNHLYNNILNHHIS